MADSFSQMLFVGGLACAPGPELARELACFRPGGFAPPASLEPEARSLLARLDQALRPLPEATLRVRLRNLAEIVNAGVANPLPGAALDMRCAALWVACAPLPAVVWEGAVEREALRAFRFFPSVAELTAFLQERSAPARCLAARLGLLLADMERRARAYQRQAQREAAWHAARPGLLNSSEKRV